MNFLTARWTNLILLNYAVDPALLEPLLPRGTRPDLLRGQAFVSLVAFHFLNTRVLGVRWPGYVNFTEINLRFYVRANGDRGVVFVREFVPLRLIAWAARATYNEPYRAVPMKAKVASSASQLRVTHTLSLPSGPQRIDVLALNRPEVSSETSDAHWFKEQRWGFGTDHFGRTLRYEVTHPLWRVYPVQHYRLSWDWAAAYGEQWSVLQNVRPHSCLFAEGSAVAVKPSGPLK